MANNIDYVSYYEQYIEGVKKRVEEQVRENTKKAYREFFIFAKDKLEEMFDKAIAGFYADYNPQYYDRQYDLYGILVLELHNDGMGMSLDYDPSKLHYRNGYSGEDGLYDQVFIKGWHGGADHVSDSKVVYPHDKHPEPGVPYWRYPEGLYTVWGNKAKIYSPSSDVTGPWKQFDRAVDDYWDNQMQNDFDAIYDKYQSQINI